MLSCQVAKLLICHRGREGLSQKVCGGESLGSCSMEVRSNNYSETHEKRKLKPVE